MVQTGMASPYPTPQFPQNGEALPIKATEAGGGGGSIAGQLKPEVGPPVPAYSPPVSAAVAVANPPVNGIEQQNVSIVSTTPPSLAASSSAQGVVSPPCMAPRTTRISPGGDEKRKKRGWCLNPRPRIVKAVMRSVWRGP